MNDSICSIAVQHIEGNQITFNKEYLVNPEASFDDYNMNIHHINAQLVLSAPTFLKVWSDIEQFFNKGIIIGHNVTFDLNVIGKALAKCNIELPDVQYICTLEKSRRHISQQKICNYKLDTLCDCFQIDLNNHHNAMCDVNACRELFDIFSKDYGIDNKDVKVYSFIDKHINSAKSTMLQKAMNELYGIIYGIGCDNEISNIETKAVVDWLEENKDYRTYDEFCTCYKLLEAVLVDSVISKDEYNQLMSCINVHMSSNLFSDSTLSMQVLLGIIKGISIDKKVDTEEAKKLFYWMKKHENLKNNYPYDKIFYSLEKTLADGIVDEDEGKNLINLFEKIINPIKSNSNQINLAGKTCCLTGAFTNGTKADIEEFIISKGGLCINGLNKSVDYLIVGGQGSVDWKFGNYGSKVNKAIQMQEKGYSIQIVSEEEIYS